MKSLFPSSNKAVEQIRLGEDSTCDVYTWVSPEGVKIAAHMIMPCPSCGYPLSLATSEFDFDSNTLSHKVKMSSVLEEDVRGRCERRDLANHTDE